MKSSLNETLNNCHSFIKEGKTDQAALILKTLNSAKIPRDLALETAKLCRRAGLFTKGLQVLKHIVATDKYDLQNTPATPKEIGEYSILLFKTGCINEALLRLGEIKSSQVEEASLYKGYAHIMQWDYNNAITELNKYIQAVPDSFSKLVAKVNLAAALVNVSHNEEAKQQIQQNISESITYNNKRLLANSYELLAQVEANQNNYSEAREFLEKAWKILENDVSSDQLFIIKWKAILDGLQHSDVSRLQVARQEALARGHWETFRDLDYYQLQIKFNPDLFSKLYCGTPFKAYKQKLRGKFKIQEQLPDHCIVGDSGPVLDVRSSLIVDGGQLSLPPPQVQLAFQNIWSDLYRAQSVGSLFEKTYQGQYYNPDSSPNRVHRIIGRVREWILQNHLPIEIEFLQSGFKAHLKGSIRLLISNSEDAPIDNSTSMLVKWNRIESQFKNNTSLSSYQVADLLNESQSNSSRLLTWAVTNNILVKKGRGKATRYLRES